MQRSTTDAASSRCVVLWLISADAEGFFVCFSGLDLHTKRQKKKVQDATVHDHSFVHGTMMALESVLLWCLSVFFIFIFFYLAF